MVVFFFWAIAAVGWGFTSQVNGAILSVALFRRNILLYECGFLVSKLVLGFGLGFLLTLAPLATSEIALVVLRGLSTAGVNLGIVFGQLLPNAVIKAFSERTDVWACRVPFVTQFVFIVFLGVSLPFVPDTPWYLARKDKYEAAKAAIIKLYGPKVDASSKLASILDTIAEENSASDKETSWVDCARGTDLVRTMTAWAYSCASTSSA